MSSFPDEVQAEPSGRLRLEMRRPTLTEAEEESAASANRNSQISRIKGAQCEGCSRQFGTLAESRRSPLVLSCGHSCCKQCIRSALKNSNPNPAGTDLPQQSPQMSCPTCQVSCSISDGLPPNHNLMDVMRNVEAHLNKIAINLSTLSSQLEQRKLTDDPAPGEGNRPQLRRSMTSDPTMQQNVTPPDPQARQSPPPTIHEA